MKLSKWMTLVVSIIMSVGVLAQDTTKLVVSSAPGGITHKYALAIAPVIAKGTNTRTVLEIRAGGEGLIAARYVNEFRNSSEVVLMIGTQKDWQGSNQGLSQIDDFVTVAYLGYVPAVIVTNPSQSCNTLKCFLDQSKSRKLSYGIAINSPVRPLIKLLVERYGTPNNVTEVPFKAGGEGVTAAMGGHVDFSITALEVAETLISSQKIKVIATVGNVPAYQSVSLRAQGLPVEGENKYCPHLFLWSNLTSNMQVVSRIRDTINRHLVSEEFGSTKTDFHIHFTARDLSEPSEVLKTLLAR